MKQTILRDNYKQISYDGKVIETMQTEIINLSVVENYVIKITTPYTIQYNSD